LVAAGPDQVGDCGVGGCRRERGAGGRADDEASTRGRISAGHGGDSPPPDHGAVIAAAIPGARHEIVAAAAHLANVEQAPAVTKLLVSHFA
jgi:pimeloyl-ACP methyl ester carboxylesterase